MDWRCGSSSTCFVSTKPWFQTPTPPKKKNLLRAHLPKTCLFSLELTPPNYQSLSLLHTNLFQTTYVTFLILSLKKFIFFASLNGPMIDHNTHILGYNICASSVEIHSLCCYFRLTKANPSSLVHMTSAHSHPTAVSRVWEQMPINVCHWFLWWCVTHCCE
jgi:hypothetical protein